MSTALIEVSPGVSRHFDVEGGDGLSSGTPFRTRFFSQGSTSATIATNTQAIVLTEIHNCQKLAIQCSNTGGAALTAFAIETRPHPSGSWVPRLNAASHFTSPPSESILRVCSDATGSAVNPVTLAAGSVVDIVLDLTDFLCADLRIVASSTGTTLSIRHTGV